MDSEVVVDEPRLPFPPLQRVEQQAERGTGLIKPQSQRQPGLASQALERRDFVGAQPAGSGAIRKVAVASRQVDGADQRVLGESLVQLGELLELRVVGAERALA